MVTHRPFSCQLCYILERRINVSVVVNVSSLVHRARSQLCSRAQPALQSLNCNYFPPSKLRPSPPHPQPPPRRPTTQHLSKFFRLTGSIIVIPSTSSVIPRPSSELPRVFLYIRSCPRCRRRHTFLLLPLLILSLPSLPRHPPPNTATDAYEFSTYQFSTSNSTNTSDQPASKSVIHVKSSIYPHSSISTFVILSHLGLRSSSLPLSTISH